MRGDGAWWGMLGCAGEEWNVCREERVGTKVFKVERRHGGRQCHVGWDAEDEWIGGQGLCWELGGTAKGSFCLERRLSDVGG